MTTPTPASSNDNGELTSRLLSEAAYAKIAREVAKYPPDQKQAAVMASLTIAQQEKGWMSP